MTEKTEFQTLNELIGVGDIQTTDESKEVIPYERPPFVPEVEFDEHAQRNDHQQELDADFVFARKSIQKMIEHAQNVLDNALQEVAAGNPHALRIASEATKNIAELSKDLIELHARVNEMSKETQKEAATTINGDVHVHSISTLELLDMYQDKIVKDVEVIEIKND